MKIVFLLHKKWHFFLICLEAMLWLLESKQPPRSIFYNLRFAGFFLQGSAKIVALNLEDPYRSARSLQKCVDFCKRFLQKWDFLQRLRFHSGFILIAST